SHSKHNHFSETDDSPQVPLFRWEASTSLKRIHLHKSDENSQKAIIPSLEHYRQKRQIRRFKLASRRSKGASKFLKSTTTALPKTTIENSRNNFEMMGNMLSGGRFSPPKKSPQQQILGLDLLVVTDYSVYKQFLDNAHGDEYQAENAIYRYYTSILNETVKEAPWVLNSYGRNTTFSTTSTTTTSVSSEIWNFTDQRFVASDGKNGRGDYEEEEMYALKTTRIDAYETLRNFQTWIKDNANNLPEHDHAIAMTR
uniref:Uncharacterized protein n=1 Tax=Romanomermis culicivorax TaxID=13658 RepID=A0A915IGS2_ROMCU